MISVCQLSAFLLQNCLNMAERRKTVYDMVKERFRMGERVSCLQKYPGLNDSSVIT